MQLSLRVRSHGLLVCRLCLLPDTPIIAIRLDITNFMITMLYFGVTVVTCIFLVLLSLSCYWGLKATVLHWRSRQDGFVFFFCTSKIISLILWLPEAVKCCLGSNETYAYLCAINDWHPLQLSTTS